MMDNKTRTHKNITNEDIASVLARIADLLETQQENVHRVNAYRNAASSLRELKESVADMVFEGDDERLREIPGVGVGLSRLISTYVHSGESNLLNHLQSEVDPEDLFAQVPAIGEKLAHRITRQLNIKTLEELEQAAHDGRLQDVEGFGPKRIQTIQASMAGMLSRGLQRRARQRVGKQEERKDDRPDIETLLDVDAEYRKKAQAGELRKITPKRFNPEGKAWLPVLNTPRGDWHFTVLYSNTARAHDLGMTQDWVVIYYVRDTLEDQVTVVTKKGGPMDGKRVVRGRESECLRYCQEQD